MKKSTKIVLLAVLLYTHEPAPASEEPLSQSSEN